MMHPDLGEPVEVGDGGAVILDPHTRVAIIAVMAHDFGDGKPVMAAKLAMIQSGRETSGWVGVGSMVNTQNGAWSVTEICPRSAGGPSVRIEPPQL